MLIILHCAFCEATVEVEVLPEWPGTFEKEGAFCPEHAPAKAFFDDQCPGCVAGLNLDAAEETWQVNGGCRSGRYSTQAALVICAPGAPIGKWHREGGEVTETRPWPEEPEIEIGIDDFFAD